MAKRMRARRPVRGRSSRKTTWLEMAQTACPMVMPFTVQQGSCISDSNSVIQNHGATLISELELDRFEEDVVLLRIVGQLHWRFQSSAEAAPGGHVRLKWGLLKQLSDPQEFVLECGPYEPDSMELPWLTMREVMLPAQGSQFFAHDTWYASWSYPSNAMLGDVDITVKRKFDTHEQLNLWAQIATGAQPSTAPYNVDIELYASLRALLLHD